MNDKQTLDYEHIRVDGNTASRPLNIGFRLTNSAEDITKHLKQLLGYHVVAVWREVDETTGDEMVWLTVVRDPAKSYGRQ